jgi:putative endonuclease
VFGHKQAIGREGEEIAEKYLKKQGCKILERNYRCPTGEVDLIVTDRKVIVFVEVKMRSGSRFGVPIESVHPQKQRRLIKAALWFLSQYNLHDREARFDVIGISAAGNKPVIEHIRNAFDVE